MAHTGAVDLRPRKYVRRIVAFFDRALRDLGDDLGEERHCDRLHCPVQMKPLIPHASLPDTGTSVSVSPVTDHL